MSTVKLGSLLINDVLVLSMMEMCMLLMGSALILSTVELCTLLKGDVEQQASRSADAFVSHQACAAQFNATSQAAFVPE